MMQKATSYFFGLATAIAITLLYIAIPAQPASAAAVTKTFTSGSNVILSSGGSAGSGSSNKIFQQASVGRDFACVTNTSQQVYCAGSNHGGQLGNGSNTDSSTPVQFGASTSKLFTQLSAGNFDTCAASTNQQVYCSGQNDQGQLGNGNNINSPTPVQFGASTGKAFIQVSNGSSTTCATTTDQQIYCAGQNAYGQFGNPTGYFSSSTPFQFGASTGKSFTQVSAGIESTSCATTTDQQIYCAGYNSNGQLGNGTVDTSSYRNTTAIRFGASTGKLFTQVATGYDHTCGLTTDQQVYCAGQGISSRELGNNTGTGINYTGRGVAVRLGASTGKSFTQVATDGNAACATTTDQQVYCAGNNNFGRFGNGNPANAATAVQAFTL